MSEKSTKSKIKIKKPRIRIVPNYPEINIKIASSIHDGIDAAGGSTMRSNPDDLMNKFNNEVKKFYIRTLTQLYEYMSDDKKQLVKEHKNKYKFLKRKSKRACYMELIKYNPLKLQFTEDELDDLTKSLIRKIQPLFKHSQTCKTFLCNLRIIESIRLNRFVIAVTKNTLFANQQWTIRLIKLLKEKFPKIPPKDLILVISSKKNDLKGNATHCRNMAVAKGEILGGKYKMMFICSNKTRFKDVLDFLDTYKEYKECYRLPIEIHHDEAHNQKDGVPAHRPCIENLLFSPYVESYIPCTSSPDPIYNGKLSDDNPLFVEENLKINQIDYTTVCAIKSDSPEYSSLHDANRIILDKYTQHSSYQEYGQTQFTRENFMKTDIKDYDKITEDELPNCYPDIDKRRQLEFCTFMKFEEESLNIGKNILDNYLFIKYNHGDEEISEKLFMPNQMNIHLIITPCRCAFTRCLMLYAMEKDYDPICIGLYRGKIHIMYTDKNGRRHEISKPDWLENCGKELNGKLNDILNWLRDQGINTEKPIIIMGNYQPTGESITFVNFEYGTLKSVIILPSLSQRYEDYQSYCRLAYTDKLFKEKNPDFVQPPKWMIGSEENINNALEIEITRDRTTDYLRSRENSSSTSNNNIVLLDRPQSIANADKTATPIKIDIEDTDNENYLELNKIFKKSQRAPYGKRILELLNIMKEEGIARVVDQTGRFDFTKYELKSVRVYNKLSDQEKEKRERKCMEKGTKCQQHGYDYRFEHYYNKFTTNQPYCRDHSKKKLAKNECELMACVDNYSYGDHTNFKKTMYISYKY